jgi:two-component system, chemotaxis family, response regulator Rcp1
MDANNTVIDILLVEDSEGDARLAKEALRESKVMNKVYHVIDGVEAMSFLRKEGEYTGVPRPHLILLDLNLPRKDGREVLSEIKNNDDLKRIPVVVLTISNDERDIVRSYNLHVNCFITKPIDFEKFLQVIRSIDDFWLSIVQLPNN